MKQEKCVHSLAESVAFRNICITSDCILYKIYSGRTASLRNKKNVQSIDRMHKQARDHRAHLITILSMI